MPGTLTLDALKKLVASGEIDTVLVAAPDMQGRLMGGTEVPTSLQGRTEPWHLFHVEQGAITPA